MTLAKENMLWVFVWGDGVEGGGQAQGGAVAISKSDGGSAQRTAEKELANIEAALGTGGHGHPVWHSWDTTGHIACRLRAWRCSVTCQGERVEVLGKQWD